MIWWWMPFMGLFDTAEAGREDAEGAIDQDEKRERPRAMAKRAAAKSKRKTAVKTAGRKRRPESRQ
jgi:hypothetical protein